MPVKVAKSRILFRCQECGYSSPKWLGKCPECSKWNSLVEETAVERSKPLRTHLTDFSSEVSAINEISLKSLTRMETGITEFDRIMGGGMVPGCLVLLGGPPGIGKSTLMLQVVHRAKRRVLYVSGEESREQIKSRADRLGVDSAEIFLVSETQLENILECVRKIQPDLLVIDSIQTTYREDLASAPGSVGQVRECAAEFLRLAKSSGITVFVLGHVTKEGDLAGPRVLEHIVDTVLYFETEKHHTYRILRSYKNRFGPTSEIGIFEMGTEGLVEVKNPSEIFLSEHKRQAGSALVAAMEGSRPLILEVQALVTHTPFGLPRRMVTGIDYNRVLMLTAVLEKRLRLNLQNQDIFVNLAGGIKMKEPSVDLGVACAVASAFGNFVPASDGIFVGEVGLGGEVRSGPQHSVRLKEAERLGLSWAVVPKRGMKEKFESKSLKVVPVESLDQAVTWMKPDK